MTDFDALHNLDIIDEWLRDVKPKKFNGEFVSSVRTHIECFSPTDRQLRAIDNIIRKWRIDKWAMRRGKSVIRLSFDEFAW